MRTFAAARWWRAVAAATALAACNGLTAQEQLRVAGPSPAKVRLGDYAVVDLVVEGPQAAPRRPEPPAVAGLQCEVTGPSRVERMSTIGGRTTQSATVTWRLVLTPRREGVLTIPPFRFWTGTREQQVGPLQLETVRDLDGAQNGSLAIEFDRVRAYVHEPVRIRIEVGVDAGLRLLQGRANGVRYYDCEVLGDWLRNAPFGDAIALPEDEAANRSPIVLNQHLQPAHYSQQNRGTGTWHTFRFERAFLPTRPGSYELAAPTLRFRVQLREGNDRDLFAYGKPVQLEILPIPSEGRPADFSGAVGQFQVRASVDRDRVVLGSSLKLSWTATGSGNFEYLRPPDPTALTGWHKLGETLQRSAQAITVVYDLTPTTADCKAIPALPWNWFDTTPGVERFVAAATEPIPVHVTAPEGMTDVAPLPARDLVRPGVDDIFGWLPHDGAPVVLPPPPSRLRELLLLLSPWLLFALATGLVAWHRRRRQNAPQRRARAAAGAVEHALAAGNDPGGTLVQYLAARTGIEPAALVGPEAPERLRDAGLPDDVAQQAAAAVEQGLAQRYGGRSVLGAEAVRAVVAQCERTLPAFLLCLLLGGLAAQQPEPAGPDPVAAAAAAYAAGDYAASRQHLERALQSPHADRRLHYDLGNCHYRLGDLPRALWAYECARLAMPRHPELLANLRLVRGRLQLGDGGGEPFTAAVAAMRASLSRGELLALCVALQAAAAALCWSRRTRLFALLPGLLGALGACELLLWQPARPPLGIVLRAADLTAEPRAGSDLPRVLGLLPGVEFDVLGSSGDWHRVQVRDRIGYLPAEAVGVVR